MFWNIFGVFPTTRDPAGPTGRVDAQFPSKKQVPVNMLDKLWI